MSKLNDSENDSNNDFHIIIDNKNINLNDSINEDFIIINSKKK